MKQIFLIILMVSMILLTACSNSTDGLVSVDDSESSIEVVKETPKTESIKTSEPSTIKEVETQTTTSDVKMEKYAVFEAEFACELLGVTDGNQMMQIMNSQDQLSSKYGFTSDELKVLKTKYSDDVNFKTKVNQRVNELCPKKANLYLKK